MATVFRASLRRRMKQVADADQRILVLGCRGQLGTDCMEFLGGLASVAGADLPELDIRDSRAVERAVEASKPDLVINCAAFTRVDDCETTRTDAFAVNAEAPGQLAGLCARRGIGLVHISTDYVFDGKKPVGESYVESDPAAPLSAYGESKLAGEKSVLAAFPGALVLRSAWLYGASGPNFLKAILARAVRPGAGPLRVVDDQRGTPTWTARLARQIWAAASRGMSGICHASAEGACSRYELAVEFLRLMEVGVEVFACSTAEYPRPAKVPANAVLENAAIKNAGVNVMVDWRADVAEFVAGFRGRLLAEAAGRRTT